MKTLIVSVFALVYAASTNAQKVYFGLKGGINVSSLSSSDNSPFESKVGFNIGGLAHIHASKTWAIQPELIYSLEGAKQTLIGSNAKAVTNLHYLDIPVLLQYFFLNGFRLEGGPQMGFLLNAKTKTGDVTVNDKGFQSTAVSIPLGIGYLSSTGLGLDARYVFGLSNINDNNDGPAIQNNVFQLGFFYQFNDTKIHRR